MLPTPVNGYCCQCGVPIHIEPALGMEPARVPSNGKSWEAIDIFLFENGQEGVPPRKYHLTYQDLNAWDDTLENLSKTQSETMDIKVDLFTIQGQKILSPLELKNGSPYVAVVPPDSFIDSGYESYLVKATRSLEKRLKNASILRVLNEDDINSIKKCLESGCCEMIQTISSPCPTPISVIQNRPKAQDRIPSLSDNSDLHRHNKKLAVPTKKRTTIPRYQQSITSSKRIMNSMPSIRKKSFHKKESFSKTNTKEPNQSHNKYNIRKKYAENIKRVSINKPRRLRSTSIDRNNTRGTIPPQNVNESHLTHMNEQLEPQIINNHSYKTNANTQDGPFRTYITDYNVLHQLILDMAHKQSKKFFLENASGTQADERVVSNIDQLRDLLEYITTADRNYQKIIIEDKINPKTDNTIITNVDELKSLLDVMNAANIVLKSDKKMILDRNLKIRTKDKVVTNIDQLHELVTDSNEKTTTSKSLTVKHPIDDKSSHKKSVPLKINKIPLSDSSKKNASYKDEEIQIIVIQSDKNVGSLESSKCTDSKTTQEPSKTSVKPSNIDQYVAVINRGDGNAKLSIDLQQAEGGIRSFISSQQTGNVIKINSGSQILPFNEITSIDEAMLATLIKDAKIDKNNTKLIVVKCICCDKLKIIDNTNTPNPKPEADEQKPPKESVMNEEAEKGNKTLDDLLNKRISIPPAKNFLTITETDKLAEASLESSIIISENVEDIQTLEVSPNLNTPQITKSASLPKSVSDASNTIGIVFNYGQSSKAHSKDLSSTDKSTKSSYRQSLSHNADEGISTNIGKIANDTLDLILNENENVFTDIGNDANEKQRFSLNPNQEMPTETGVMQTYTQSLILNENERVSTYIDELPNTSQRLSLNANHELLTETGEMQTDRLSLTLNENERTITDIGGKPNANQGLSFNANQEILIETGRMQTENERISTDFDGKPKETQRLSLNENLEVSTETSGIQTERLSSTLNENEVILSDIDEKTNTRKSLSQIADITIDNHPKSNDRQSLIFNENEYTPVNNGVNINAKERLSTGYDKIVNDRLNTSPNVSEVEKYISQCKYETNISDDNQTTSTAPPGISPLLKEMSSMNDCKTSNPRQCTLENCGYGADSQASQPNTNMTSAEMYDEVKSQADSAAATNETNYEINSSFDGVHSRNAENTSPMQIDQDKINRSKISEANVSTKYVSGRSVSIDDKITAHIPISCTSSEHDKESCCSNVNNPNITQGSVPEMPSATKYSDNNQLKNEWMNGTQNSFVVSPTSKKRPSSPKIKLLDNRDSTTKTSATSATITEQQPTYLRNTQSATTKNATTDNGDIYVSIAPLETSNIKKNENIIEKRVSQSTKKISISNSTNSISKSGKKYNVPTVFEPSKYTDTNSAPSELDTLQKSDNRRGSVRVIKANSITPRTSKSSDYTGPSILELMQKQKESEKSSCASDKMSYSPNYLVDKYTQTESLDLLLVARRHEDSHYSFHFPTLEDLKQYQLL